MSTREQTIKHFAQLAEQLVDLVTRHVKSELDTITDPQHAACYRADVVRAINQLQAQLDCCGFWATRVFNAFEATRQPPKTNP